MNPPGPALRVVYVLVIHLPAEGVDSFQRYEATVLPLLSEHQGRLERRLCSADERTEVHLVSFPSVELFEAYRNDSRRAEHSHLLERARARIELYALSDVSGHDLADSGPPTEQSPQF